MQWLQLAKRLTVNLIHPLPQLSQASYFLIFDFDVIKPFLKRLRLVRPHVCKNRNLIVNTSTPYHRGDMMNDQRIVMLCMTNIFIKLTQDARKTTPFY